MTVLDLPDQRPTLADVARAAGVSSATASRVINGFAKVRPETRQQVEDAITTLGYVRQRAGHRRERPQTGSIAFVVCEQARRLSSDPFLGRVLWGASRVLAPAGFQAVLSMAQTERDSRSMLHYLRSGRVDGALFVGMHPRFPIALERIGVPVVSAGRPAGDYTGRYSYVDADNHGGAARAVEYLIAQGRTRIATVAGPKDTASGADRLAGYRAALAAHGRFDPGLVVHGDFGQVSGEHLARRLLERRPDLDAIFVASDLMALGALRALRRAGRTVPDDVAVIGFDNSPVARSVEPALTTVSQPIEAMGARTARELLALIVGDTVAPRRIVLPTELILRESA
jgi:DNA-binding LacI/PurR family transcriptional regulator